MNLYNITYLSLFIIILFISFKIGMITLFSGKRIVQIIIYTCLIFLEIFNFNVIKPLIGASIFVYGGEINCIFTEKGKEEYMVILKPNIVNIDNISLKWEDNENHKIEKYYWYYKAIFYHEGNYILRAYSDTTPGLYYEIPVVVKDPIKELNLKKEYY